LAQSLQSSGVSENTYSEVSYASLQHAYDNLNNLVSARQAELAAEHQRQGDNEQLRVQFANLANSFSSWAKQQQEAIENLSGDAQSQLNQLQSLSAQFGNAQGQYRELVAAQHQLDDRQVTDNTHTPHTIEALKSQWDSLNILTNKKQQVLEKEILAQSGSGLSAEQLQEFKECFKHFDKDADNLLDRLELGACLKSLGEEVNFDQGGKLDQILQGIDGDGDGKVTFDEFAGYMERVSGGSDTPDSIKNAFKTLAGDKDYVTEADLRSVLPAEKVDYILARIKPYPGKEGAYDYNTFTDSLYGR
jgi:Ca2+-binding EF-hand superfamily protein